MTTSAATTIIVPIYNAYLETEQCIAALARTLASGRQRVVLINDGSTDARLSQLLQTTARSHPSWTVIDRSDNCGFVRTVNQGLELCPGHAIILNSDTRVTSGWVERMERAAAASPRVASITPWSNAATICSLFAYCVERPLPEGWSEEDVQACLDRVSPRQFPTIPTGVGYCMLMTAQALREVGYLDVASFPRGYGEENDWCERAKSMGFHHRLDDTTFIYHKGSASFAEDQHAHRRHGARVIATRWPNFSRDVALFIESRVLEGYVRLVAHAMASPPVADSVLRVLHVLHSDPRTPNAAGVEFHVQQLAKLSASNIGFHFSYVWPTENGFAHCEDLLDNAVAFRRGKAWTHSFAGPVTADPAWTEIFDLARPDLVHVHHTMRWGPMFLAWLVERAPTIATIHDYFWVCPHHNLINRQTNRYCGIPSDRGVCASCLGDGPFASLTSIDSWRALHAPSLARIHAFISPSRAAAREMLRVYPELGAKVRVMGHSLDGERSLPAPKLRREGLSVLVLGYRANEKGSDLLNAVAKSAPGVRFVCLGQSSYADAPTNVEFAGPYLHSEVFARIEKAACDVALFLARGPETFSYTLSEALLCGLPAIVSNLGAQAERVADAGAGWIYEATNVSSVAAIIARLQRNPDMIEDARRAVQTMPIGSSSEAYAAMIENLYREASSASTGVVARNA